MEINNFSDEDLKQLMEKYKENIYLDLIMYSPDTFTSGRPKKILPTSVMRSLTIMQMLVTTNEASLYWSGEQRLSFMLGLLNRPTGSTDLPTLLITLRLFLSPRCMCVLD